MQNAASDQGLFALSTEISVQGVSSKTNQTSLHLEMDLSKEFR